MTAIDISVLTAITGGIGSGKSVVAGIVSALGYEVYDCDLRAKALMESSDIKSAMAGAFGTCIFDPQGKLMRPALASIVFSDPDSLRRLNDITHSAVRADLSRWVAERKNIGPIFVETAILYQSGLDKMVDNVWEVTAPRDLRISRVCRRNAMEPADVVARIESQEAFSPAAPHPSVSIIVNDGFHPLLPQIEKLIANIS